RRSANRMVRGPSPECASHRPVAGEIGHDRGEALVCGVLVEEDEVVEHPYQRHPGRDRRLLVDRHAGGLVKFRHLQNAAGFLCSRRPIYQEHRQRQRRRGDDTEIRPHAVSSLCSISDPSFAAHWLRDLLLRESAEVAIMAPRVREIRVYYGEMHRWSTTSFIFRTRLRAGMRSLRRPRTLIRGWVLSATW